MLSELDRQICDMLACLQVGWHGSEPRAAAVNSARRFGGKFVPMLRLTRCRTLKTTHAPVHHCEVNISPLDATCFVNAEAFGHCCDHLWSV